MKKFLEYILLGLGILTSQAALSQIVIPDQTLPNISTVTQQDNQFIINGGTSAGQNLFHSFQDFSVFQGNTVYFNNSLNTQNIFTRVTGSSSSQIDGLIRANGIANLFLLNPNGILFGPNAALDIGGSFLATTANSIRFADGLEFGTANRGNLSSLSINVPIGLQFDNSGLISVNGAGHNLAFAIPELPYGGPIINRGESVTGLRVSPGKTLALIGGQVQIQGGVLTAPSGNILIGSIGQGNLDLTVNYSDISLNSTQLASFANIFLTDKALIDASGSNGNINIVGENLFLKNGAIIFISNIPTGSSSHYLSSQINININNSIVLDGVTDLNSFQADAYPLIRGIYTQNFSTNSGTNILINAQNLRLQKFSFVTTVNFGLGSGGDIFLNLESLEINGNPPLNFLFYPSVISTNTLGQGNSGNITIFGRNLSLQNGGLIITQSLGAGNAGNIIITGANKIELTGAFPLEPSFKSLNFSAIATTSSVSGEAGNITINTDHLLLKDGGRINSTISALGNAGNIYINAKDSIEIIGKVSETSEFLGNRSQIIASAEKTNEQFQLLWRCSKNGNLG